MSKMRFSAGRLWFVLVFSGRIETFGMGRVEYSFLLLCPVLSWREGSCHEEVKLKLLQIFASFVLFMCENAFFIFAVCL